MDESAEAEDSVDESAEEEDSEGESAEEVEPTGSDDESALYFLLTGTRCRIRRYAHTSICSQRTPIIRRIRAKLLATSAGR